MGIINKLKNKFFKNKKSNTYNYNSITIDNHSIVNPYKHKTFFPQSNYSKLFNSNSLNRTKLPVYRTNYDNLNDDYNNLIENEVNNVFEYGYDYYSEISSNLRRSISLNTNNGSINESYNELADYNELEEYNENYIRQQEYDYKIHEILDLYCIV